MPKLPRKTSAQKLINLISNEGWLHSTTKGRECTFIKGYEPQSIIMVTLTNEISVGVLNKAIKTKALITGKSRDEIVKELK